MTEEVSEEMIDATTEETFSRENTSRVTIRIEDLEVKTKGVTRKAREVRGAVDRMVAEVSPRSAKTCERSPKR